MPPKTDPKTLARSRAWKARNREHNAAYMRAWYERNKDRRADYNRAYYPTWYRGERRDALLTRLRAQRYRLTPAEVAELFAWFGHHCAICGKSERLVIDHDHLTGYIRGVLCNRCNLALGQLGDIVESLERAVRYLRQDFVADLDTEEAA